MSDPDLPSIEPVPDDGVGVATVGTALWALAALACLLGRDTLAEAGREWWLWTCIAGFGLGLGDWPSSGADPGSTASTARRRRRPGPTRRRPVPRASPRPHRPSPEGRMARRWGSLTGPLVVGGLSAALLCVGPAASAGLRSGDEVLCRFDTAELPEVSGLASSQQHPGIVWATNDSGRGPYLYAVSIDDCRIRATLRLLDTPARDHEALAIGRDAEGRDVIWIGDIGDNADSWPYVRIHKVIEPAKLRDAAVPVTTYRFTYPDGPRNAEALLADPRKERLWVISKESGVGGIYALPSPMSPSRTPMQAERVGDARAMVTDAAMAPGGARYVVRDYLSAEVFTGTPPGTAQARFGLPLQPQGEAVTWADDGRALLVASENSPDLVRVDVPAVALGTDEGIASVLPRVAGFDIYPYARIAAVGAAALLALVVIGRSVGTRRRRRQGVEARARGPARAPPAPQARAAPQAGGPSGQVAPQARGPRRGRPTRVSAATSAGSTEGNIATRSWLRPSLR